MTLLVAVGGRQREQLLDRKSIQRRVRRSGILSIVLRLRNPFALAAESARILRQSFDDENRSRFMAGPRKTELRLSCVSREHSAYAVGKKTATGGME
jgi:hypothetical protein